MALSFPATASPSTLCLCTTAQVRLPLPMAGIARLQRWLNAAFTGLARRWTADIETAVDSGRLRVLTQDLSRTLSAATRRDLGLTDEMPRRESVWQSGDAPWL